MIGRGIPLAHSEQMKKFLILVFLVSGCGAQGTLVAPQEIDSAGLAGSWSGTETSQDLSQSFIAVEVAGPDSHLTGTWKNASNGALGTLNGSIDGSQVTFTLIETAPCVGTLDVTGVVDGSEIDAGVNGSLGSCGNVSGSVVLKKGN